MSLSDPDPALFRPPAEYAVVDEAGTFAVQLPRALPAAPSLRRITALTDMPFSAEQVSERIPHDPDGATPAHTFSLFFYRDGMGRTAMGSMVVDSTGRQTFRPSLITDVVAGCSYTFDQQGTAAHRHPLQVSFKPASSALLPRSLPSSTNTLKNGVVAVTEWLGTQAIQGFQTYGLRTTLKYPPGSLGGNDRLFVTVDEFWNAPDLGIPLLTKISDPEAGDSVATVRNLNFGEPDASIFHVPDGYRIVDDSESARK